MKVRLLESFKSVCKLTAKVACLLVFTAVVVSPKSFQLVSLTFYATVFMFFKI